MKFKCHKHLLVLCLVGSLCCVGTEWLGSVSAENKPLTIPGVCAVAWSPDGKQLAWDSNDLYTINKLSVWHTGARRLRRTTINGDVSALAWSPDRKYLAWCNLFRSGLFLRTPDGRRQVRYVASRVFMAQSLSWSPDSRYVALAGSNESAFPESNNRIEVWEAATGKLRRVLKGNYSVAWSPQGKRLACASEEGGAIIWDVPTGRKLLELGHKSKPEYFTFSISWSPDGRRLATEGRKGEVYIWDAHTGRRLHTLRSGKGHTRQVMWSPDGKLLAAVNRDWSLHVWTATGKPLYSVPVWSENAYNKLLSTEHYIGTVRLTWHPNSKIITIGRGMGEVLQIDAQTGRTMPKQW